MGPILTITPNPTIDERWEVGRLRPEGKNRVNPSRARAGGGGINVARDIVDLGHPARAVATTGGSTGALLRELLEQETSANGSFDHELIDVNDETRRSLVLVETQSERSDHLVSTGPALSTEECEQLVAGGAFPISAGADVTDEDALKVARDIGLGIVVRSEERSDVPTFAHVSGDGPDRLCELLRQLIELFESGELCPT